MTIQDIENNPVYKQILDDSFGGCLYNVDNRDKYDADEILQIWNNLTPNEQESAGGIMKGAMNFLQEK